jgi:hypothetical protein
MIEAVNSTIANATTVRGMVGQMDSASISTVATILPASSSNAAPSAPQAPFTSPYISVDFNFNKPVLQIRDSLTGAVKQQFPTEGQMAQVASSQSQMRASMQGQSTVNYVTAPTASATQTSQVAVQTVDVTTVQDVTATPASNTASSTPQIAVAALSAAAQTSAPASVSATESGVTVYA